LGHFDLPEEVLPHLVVEALAVYLVRLLDLLAVAVVALPVVPVASD
jgi:hypothetical protein